MIYCRGARSTPASSVALRGRRVTARGFQKTDRRKTGEHRDPEECGGLALREIGGAVDEVAEASIANFFGGVFDILGG